MSGFQSVLLAVGIVVGLVLVIVFSTAVGQLRTIGRDIRRLRQLLAQVSREGAMDSYSHGDYAAGAQLAEIAIRQEQIADEYDQLLHPRRRREKRPGPSR